MKTKLKKEKKAELWMTKKEIKEHNTELVSEYGERMLIKELNRCSNTPIMCAVDNAKTLCESRYKHRENRINCTNSVVHSAMGLIINQPEKENKSDIKTEKRA